MAKKKKVSGENILYHYIQKNILTTEEITPFQKELIEHLIVNLSIWIPIDVYKKMPVLLPFVVRDLSCRKKNLATGSDDWGVSDKFGYLKDDNSLIKGIFGSCPINSPHIGEYQKSYLGNGFVASHIWRKVRESEKLASTMPQLNTFVPNLVWLPKQISKLTDREKSYAQQLLQSLSYRIYRDENDDSYSELIWKHLENPKVGHQIDIRNINFFSVSSEWLDRRSKGLLTEMVTVLGEVNGSVRGSKKVKCSKYLPTLRENLDSKYNEDFSRWINASISRIS
jgi:hypothetical protein